MPLTTDQCARHRMRFHSIRHVPHQTALAKQLALWNYILEQEAIAGTRFMRAGNGIFVYLGMTQEVISMSSRNDRIAAYLHQVYGVMPDVLGKSCLNQMQLYASTHAVKTDLRRFVAYNTETKTAYVSTYDGQMWKLTGGDPERVPNGEDDVFFIDDDGGTHVEADIGPHGVLLDKLTNINYAATGVGGMLPEQQRMALTVWMFMLAFPDLMPTKPLLVVEGEPGAGKCLEKNTPVIMFDGSLRLVQDVQIGENLMGPNGLPRKVLATTAGRGPLYRITPVKGESWVCNDAHVLSLVSTDDDQIVDVPVETYLAWTPTQQTRLKQFSVGIDRFDYEAPTPIDPYFLGVWFGDGTKQANQHGPVKITITKPDPEIEQLCATTAVQWGLRVRVDSNSSGCCTYSLVSDDAGLRPNKLLTTLQKLVGATVKIPDAYARGSKETRLQFLAGFLDTDGDLSTTCFNITQKREDWARAIWWIARSVGLCATWSTRTGRCRLNDGTIFEGTYYRVSISGNTDMIPTKIPRKQAKPRQQIKDATRTGIAIEPIGDGEYFGFTLDGDSRFLLGDFTVTHNSACVQLLQVALLGASKPMILSKNKEDDFGVLLLRSPIAVFDNTDSFIEWVPDAICAYTTLGYWVKRKLFSDDDEAIIRPQAFVAVASKNPASFRREDVADRCVILRLTRRESFRSFQELQQEVLDLRPQLLGEYIWYVNQLVHRMRLYADETGQTETARMADFSKFARVIGEQLHWKTEDVDGLMSALAAERDAFINEDDPLVDLLHKWIAYRGGGFNSIGRERTLHELHAELESQAQIHDITYYKSARTLAQKIRSPHIDRDFDVEVIIRDSRKIYKIWRKTDPHLTSVAPATPFFTKSAVNEEGEIEFG